jgi:hypothetical protein
VSRSRIGLLRGDSGFFDGKLLTLLEGEQGEKEVPYIIRARMTSRLRDAITQVTDWYAWDDVQPHVCYQEIQYQATTWHRPRRIILVRTPKEVEKDPALAQGVLFEAEADWQRYEYKAFVTNTEDSAASIHRRYNQRADCENRIKELKYDYSIDGFALQSFAAMEAAFRWIMVAYNLMSLFRQKVMTSPKASRLSTIRFQCIAIGSYLVKSGRKKKGKLSAEGKRRHFLEHFFTNLEELQPPFQFSIA